MEDLNNSKFYGFAKITEILNDLIVLRSGWHTNDEHKIFTDARNRLDQRAYKIKLQRLRDQLEQQIKELE